VNLNGDLGIGTGTVQRIKTEMSAPPGNVPRFNREHYRHGRERRDFTHILPLPALRTHDPDDRADPDRNGNQQNR
jgi:hypothetical protein